MPKDFGLRISVEGNHAMGMNPAGTPFPEEIMEFFRLEKIFWIIESS